MLSKNINWFTFEGILYCMQHTYSWKVSNKSYFSDLDYIQIKLSLFFQGPYNESFINE